MTPEEWQRIRPILESALDLDAPSRARFLHSACAEASLRREIESLIAAHEQAGTDFLDSAAIPDVSFEEEARFHLPPSKRIGVYEILGEIAQGGMGAVYRAIRADGQYKQQVALKIVRADLGADLAATRFRNERQILASLDHPNIARILDGGTTADGIPYFVMEFIDGLPIAEYCDREKLPIDARLKLFRTVCSAVHYAHQHLVIHRDIKPGNILITAEGVPKLLDFGIAKILDPSLLPENVTLTAGPWVMTPEYASPEQLRGRPITTATDVYSLGLVLYELLSGHRAYRFPSHMPHAIARVVLETEPEKPSTVVQRREAGGEGQQGKIDLTPEIVSGLRGDSSEKLRRRLAGDLDNIVLKAIRKEPRERYNSADQLSEDIRRHLEGLPVLARGSTVAYRGRKYVLRHKVGVAAAVLVFLSLLTGIAVTLHEARIARAQRALAERRFADIMGLAKSNLFEFHDAIQKLPGSAPARHLVLQRALEYLDKLSGDAAGDRGLMHELAAGYQRIANVQRNFSGPGIGDSKAAAASYQKAWTIRESLVASSHGDVNELKDETKLLDDYVFCLIVTGRIEEASRLAKRGLTISELVVERQPQDRGAIIEEALRHFDLGRVLGGETSAASTREMTEAIEHDRSAIRLLTQLARKKQDAEVETSLLQAGLGLAYHLSKNRQFAESLKTYDELSSTGKGPQTWPDWLQEAFYHRRALTFDRTGNFSRAYEDEQKAVAVAHAMTETDPHNVVSQIRLAMTQVGLGMEEARLGKKAAGKRRLEEGIEACKRVLAANAYLSFYKNLLVIGYGYQAEILSSSGDQAGAQAKYTQALAAATEIAQSDAGDLESRLSMAKLHTALGVVLAKAKRYSEAQDELRAASAQLEALLRIRPQDAEIAYASKTTRDDLAALYGCLGGHACQGMRASQLPNLNN